MKSFIILATLFLSFDLHAENQSDKHAALEQETEQRLKWIREQNRSVINKLKTSPNRKAVSQWIYQTYDKPEVMRSTTLDNGSLLQVIDRGLGKPTELVLKEGDKEKVLFSNYSLARNNSFSLLNFTLSPDQKNVTLALAENGSIDQFWIIPFNIEKAQATAPKFLTSSKSVSWISNSRFVTSSSRRSDVLKYDIETQKVEQEKGYYAPASVKGWYYIYGANPTLNNTQGELYSLVDDIELMAATTTHLYFKEDDPQGFGAIKRAVRVPAAVPVLEDFIPETKMVLDSVKSFADLMVLNKHIGSKRVLEMWNFQGQLLKSIDIPNCCSVREIKDSSTVQNLEMTLDSALKKKVKVSYNVTKGTWSEDIESLMMTSPSLNLESTVIDVTSADGTKIPVRLTHKKGLQADGARPVWIESYGGFNISGYLDPSYNPLMLDFFARGGIHAGPGLRGGNEYGEDWHKAGAKENKRRTFEDLIATADYFSQNGWSQPRLIISSGSSNGGLTVAASALIAPKSFGVVIPGNGVLDLLKKEIMDVENKGWAREYGDSRKPEERSYLEPVSPVELAAKSPEGPVYLIVNGRMDSRVNPAHSFKTKASFNENPNVDSRFISINNSGHWNASPYYQDLIGWRTQMIMWTTVYDHLGIKF